MKRYKRILVMLAILVVASIATVALTQYEEKQEQIRTSDAIILEISRDTVTSLSWEFSSGEALAFEKIDDVWTYQDDEAFPVSEEKISRILEKFEGFGASFTIENVEDYGQYGLDTPNATLHLATQEQSYDIKIGSFSKMDEQRYVDIGDGNVYLVSSDPMDYLETELSSMIANDDTPTFESVQDITFTGAEEYTITRIDNSAHTYDPENDIYFVEHDGKTVPLDSTTIQTYLSNVSTLALSEYVTYNASDDELNAYGLDTPLLSIAINYTYTETDENGEETTVSDTCVLHIGENAAQRAEADAALAEGEEATAVAKYVRIGNSKIVYTLDDQDFALLTAVSYDDLRHDDVFWADFTLVTQIYIALEGNAHTLIAKYNDDGECEWYYQYETPDEDAEDAEDAETEQEALAISDLKTALLALTADSFTDEQPSEVEELGLTLHLESENFPIVEIQLYRYDGSFCLAVVDGEPVSLVSRSSVMALVEAVQAIVLSA